MVDVPNIPTKASVLYVIFTAEINPTTVEKLTAVMVQAAKKLVKEVYLAISTPGGQVQAGITLYNTLSALPFDLTVHNIGNVDSIGNVVFLSGEVPLCIRECDVFVSRRRIRCERSNPHRGAVR